MSLLIELIKITYVVDYCHCRCFRCQRRRLLCSFATQQHYNVRIFNRTSSLSLRYSIDNPVARSEKKVRNEKEVTHKTMTIAIDTESCDLILKWSKRNKDLIFIIIVQLRFFSIHFFLHLFIELKERAATVMFKHTHTHIQNCFHTIYHKMMIIIFIESIR